MILIIQSLWNESLTSKLVDGAKASLQKAKQKSDLIQVPGALEIPLAIKWAWAASQRQQEDLDGVVACGVVIKGETYHFEIVANESAREIMRLSTELRLPIGNAILAVYTLDQALERSGGKLGNKGTEAADAVLSMIRLQTEKAY